MIGLTRNLVTLIQAGLSGRDCTPQSRLTTRFRVTPFDVDTAIVFADEKCAYFSHSLRVQGAPHAEVLVKMKFKQGRQTVPPRDVFGECPSDKPAHLVAWDQALENL